MKVYFVYITTGNKEEARIIGKALVESKLVACVNIIGPMNSIYMWAEKLQDETETILVAKTTEDRLPALKDKVKSMHSYECPCIVCLLVSDGHTPFLDWIAVQVHPD